MDDTTTVVRAGTADAERVRAVRLRALADAPDAFWSTEAQERAQPLEAFRSRLAVPGAATFLAVRSGADVGMAVGAPHHDTAGDAGLYAMWVAPDRRRRGTGAALIRAVLGWARAAGHPRVRLEVADANPVAIAAYTRLGFAPTGRTGAMPPPRGHVTEHELAIGFDDGGAVTRSRP